MQVFPDHLISFITELYVSETEDGNADAMNDLGGRYYDGFKGFEQSFEKAMELYHTAAENGSRQAQENLGCCPGMNGHGNKALHIYRGCCIA